MGKNHGKRTEKMCPEDYESRKVLEAAIERLATAPPNHENPTTLVDWIMNINIRTNGDAQDPAFSLSDVAKLINDTNYDRFKPSRKLLMDALDANGRRHSYVMIYEKDLFKYLMRSKRPLAEPFQDWLANLLVQLRKATIAHKDFELRMKNDEIRAKKCQEIQNTCINDIMTLGWGDSLPSFMAREFARVCIKNNVDIRDLTREDIGHLSSIFSWREHDIFKSQLKQRAVANLAKFAGNIESDDERATMIRHYRLERQRYLAEAAELIRSKF